MLRERLITDVQRLGSRQPCVIATMDILDRLEEQRVEGDFVECGVWHGVHPILAKAYVEGRGYRPRKYWCYDTFAGMPPCGPEDQNYRGGRPYDKPKDWLLVPLAEVKDNFAARKLLDKSVEFVVGMVEQTLRGPRLPTKISYLRLDTDFYASTLIELQVLYPLLVSGGALVLDDYGWWLGSQKAANEYFGKGQAMTEIDRGARLIWKP